MTMLFFLTHTHTQTSINTVAVWRNIGYIRHVAIQTSFTAIVSGPTGSGKMQFVMHLVDSVDVLIEPTPLKIIYYFAEYQPLFKHYEDRINFCHRMPKAGRD